ncbi:MAG: 3-hydroxyisobutyrate dehydrogenase [Bdellovibrionales bacterium]|nr:3-hydroxyisobutyrate dehydrogenase [Bdellovibrionales bacterium]
MKENILFIGLGNMGYPMSKKLIQQFGKLQGFDLNSQIKEEFEKSGGKWIQDLSSLQADVVFSMLPGAQEVKKLYLEEQKLLSVLKKGTLIVDCSTCDSQSVCDVFKKAKKKGLLFLSAPVSGGTKGAEKGTLTFMVGGDKKDFDLAKKYLKAMGKNIFYAGGVGDGQSVKICNNMLLAIHMVGTCEAFALGQALGLKPEVLSKIMKASSGQNWSLENYNPCPDLMPFVPSSNNYEGGFSVRLMLKDLQLAQKAMKETNQNLNLGSKVFEIYKKHFEEGFSNKDFSHVFQKINKKEKSNL